MSAEKRNSEFELIVTVLSAESLKPPSFPLLLRRRRLLRPYVVLSAAGGGGGGIHVTRVDEKGGTDPTWHDTVRVPVDPAFLLPRRRRRSGGWEEEEEDDSVAFHVSVMSRWRFVGPTEVGWCRILPCHVVDGLRPPGSARRLSYALRAGRHGGPGRGVIHLSVRLVGPGVDRIVPLPAAVAPPPSEEEEGWCQVAIGIPVGPVGFGGHVVGMDWF